MAELEALLATAINGERVNAGHLRVSFAGGATVADNVRDLTARESACCSFFEFSVSTVADQVLLEVLVPTTHVQIPTAWPRWPGWLPTTPPRQLRRQ